MKTFKHKYIEEDCNVVNQVSWQNPDFIDAIRKLFNISDSRELGSIELSEAGIMVRTRYVEK